jgi:hypothetical protein
MLTNLQDQLRQMGREDLMDALYEEIPVVRRDSGYAPLVTPTSQIIGAQATYNLITGQRYTFVSDDSACCCAVHLAVRRLRQTRGGKPGTGMDEPRLKYRPASYLHPVLEEPIDLPFIHSHKDCCCT